VAAVRHAAGERGGPLPSIAVAEALLNERREQTEVGQREQRNYLLALTITDWSGLLKQIRNVSCGFAGNTLMFAFAKCHIYPARHIQTSRRHNRASPGVKQLLSNPRPRRNGAHKSTSCESRPVMSSRIRSARLVTATVIAVLLVVNPPGIAWALDPGNVNAFYDSPGHILTVSYSLAPLQPPIPSYSLLASVSDANGIPVAITSLSGPGTCGIWNATTTNAGQVGCYTGTYTDQQEGAPYPVTGTVSLTLSGTPQQPLNIQLNGCGNWIPNSLYPSGGFIDQESCPQGASGQTTRLPIFDDLKNQAQVTGPQTISTGQHVKLSIKQPGLNGIDWSIDGITGDGNTSSAVNKYKLGELPTPLTKLTNTPTVDFYFTQPGTWNVKVNALTNKGNTLTSEVIPYTVVKPTVTFQPTLGTAGVYLDQHQKPHLGIHTAGQRTNPNVGLEYAYKTNPAPGTTGQANVAITQIISVILAHTNITDPPPPDRFNSPGLDACDYLLLESPAAGYAPIGSTIDFIDGPNKPLDPGKGTWTLTTALDTYLMYIPEDGVPTGIGDTVMQFQATADSSLLPPGWLANPNKQTQPQITSNTLSNNQVVFPQWSRTAQVNPVGCPPKPPSG
jgi:hypothetical protein